MPQKDVTTLSGVGLGGSPHIQLSRYTARMVGCNDSCNSRTIEQRPHRIRTKEMKKNKFQTIVVHNPHVMSYPTSAANPSTVDTFAQQQVEAISKNTGTTRQLFALSR